MGEGGRGGGEVKEITKAEVERVARALARQDNVDPDWPACGEEPLRIRGGGYIVGQKIRAAWMHYTPMAHSAITAFLDQGSPE